MAEGDGLLNRYTALKLYPGFKSLPLRHNAKKSKSGAVMTAPLLLLPPVLMTSVLWRFLSLPGGIMP